MVAVVAPQLRRPDCGIARHGSQAAAAQGAGRDLHTHRERVSGSASGYSHPVLQQQQYIARLQQAEDAAPEVGAELQQWARGIGHMVKR